MSGLAPRLGAAFLLSVELAVVACASDENDGVACLFTDEECIEDARLRGADVVLVDAEGNLVDGAGAVVEDSSQTPIPVDRPVWRLDTGDEQAEGAVAFVSTGDGRIALRLVNQDAVNLILIVTDGGTGERNVELAFLAFGRGKRCRYPFENAAPFTVRLEQMDVQWVVGSYDGVVQCEDRSVPTQARGTFRVSRTG